MVKKISIIMAIAVLAGCQTVPNTILASPISTQESTLDFAVTGKIGVTTQTLEGRQANSAFYTWSQTQERFAIELTGVFGIGATSISFDGQTATLINEHVNHMADTPEELLTAITGWQAPISQLSYWVVARPAPKDTQSVFDGSHRLQASTNDQWTAQFEYPSAAAHLPNRLIITHQDGHKVVMTITFLEKS